MHTNSSDDAMIKTGEETDQSAAVKNDMKKSFEALSVKPVDFDTISEDDKKRLIQQGIKHELRFNTAEYIEDAARKQAKHK